MSFRIRLEKESVKFSCSHFTVFGPTEAERLHGHNYYVTAEFSLSEIDAQLGMAFDFNLLKPVLKRLAEEFDERVLIPTRSPFLKFEVANEQMKIAHGKKQYVFPIDDVLQLDVANITSEELARDFATRVKTELVKNPSFKRIASLSIGIQETRGQTVFFDTTI